MVMYEINMYEILLYFYNQSFIIKKTFVCKRTPRTLFNIKKNIEDKIPVMDYDGTEASLSRVCEYFKNNEFITLAVIINKRQFPPSVGEVPKYESSISNGNKQAPAQIMIYSDSSNDESQGISKSKRINDKKDTMLNKLGEQMAAKMAERFLNQTSTTGI